MLRYIVRRVLYAIPILVTVSLLTFLLFYGAFPPERIARNNLSAKNPTQKQIKDWLAAHGYDKPKSEQFKTHMTSLLTFHFGKSDQNGEDILERITKGAPPSFTIALLIFVGAQIATIAAALFLAYFRGTYVDYWGTFLCVLMMSVVYIVYILTGQFVLGKLLKIYPIAGYREGVAGFKFFLLPVVVGIAQLVRRRHTPVSHLHAGRDEPGLCANGAGQRRVRAAYPVQARLEERCYADHHQLRRHHSQLCFWAACCWNRFSTFPDLGSYTVDAIQNADFAVVRAMVFLGTLLTIIGYILTDIAYGLVDPRIRLE